MQECSLPYQQKNCPSTPASPPSPCLKMTLRQVCPKKSPAQVRLKKALQQQIFPVRNPVTRLLKNSITCILMTIMTRTKAITRIRSLKECQTLPMKSLHLKIQSLHLEIRNPLLEITNPHLEIRNPLLEIRNPLFSTTNRHLEMRRSHPSVKKLLLRMKTAQSFRKISS